MSMSVGAAYVGGVSANAATARGDARRIAGAAEGGFTEAALAAAAGGLDESALAIARRHDRYSDAGVAGRDRQALLFATRLEETGKADAGAGSELDCLTQAAYYEARGEGAEGMRAVAQVVLNRVRHAAYPKSVCGVVFQGSGRRVGCQFSFTCDGSMRGAVNRSMWNRARDVAQSALSGRKFTGVGAATHFHTTAVSPVWRGALVRVGQVGDHVFYRIGRRGESTSRPSTEARMSALREASALAASIVELEPTPYVIAAPEPAPASATELTAVSTHPAAGMQAVSAPVA